MMIAVEKNLQQNVNAEPLNAQSLNGLQKLNALLSLWLKRYSQRNLLRDLEDHLLKDVGLSRVDALQEASKPFWKR